MRYSFHFNIYYDTDNWELIRKSIEKPAYKEKLRVRSYGVSRTGYPVFIEINKKYDNVVYKRRTTVPSETSEEYLAGNIKLSPGNQIGSEIERLQRIHRAKPKVYIAYDRVSFAGTENPELRITFEKNILIEPNITVDITANIDEKSIEQLVTILVDNAVSHTNCPDGTCRKVTVCLSEKKGAAIIPGITVWVLPLQRLSQTQTVRKYLWTVKTVW